MSNSLYLRILIASLAAVWSAVALADCKTVVWKDFHQYQTLGPKATVKFKLKKVKGTTVWLNCALSKPNVELLKQVSENATCRMVRPSAQHPHTAGIYCRYAKKGVPPCIKVQLKCDKTNVK